MALQTNGTAHCNAATSTQMAEIGKLSNDANACTPDLIQSQHVRQHKQHIAFVNTDSVSTQCGTSAQGMVCVHSIRTTASRRYLQQLVMSSEQTT
jgi:hypothetical protein